MGVSIGIQESASALVRTVESYLQNGYNRVKVKIKPGREVLGEMSANLVANALNYTQAPGEVTIRCRTEGSHSLIEVEDTGPCIPAAAPQQVFERFFRLPAASHPGSGLGLAIVREIARGAGGEVDILETADGRGVLLRVSLPALIDTPDEEPA